MEVARQPYLNRTKVGAVMASFALVAGCSGSPKGESSPAPSTLATNKGPEGTATAAPNTTLSPVEPSSPSLTEQYCGRDDFDVKPGTIVVDGRCDSRPETAVGIYNGTEQLIENALARAKTGAILVALCFSEGQSRQDIAGHASARWIRVDISQSDKVEMIQPSAKVGNIPAVWTQGAEAVTQEC